MRIIINLFNIVSDSEVTPFTLFVHSIVHELAKQRPSDEFVVFSSSDKLANHYLSNVKHHLLQPKNRNAATALNYHKLVLPKMFQSLNPDLIIDGSGVVFNIRKYKQIVLLDESHINGINHLWYKLFFPKYIRYAKRVVSFSREATELCLKNKFNNAEKLVKFRYTASNHFFVHELEELLTIKTQYTDSKPYFVWFCDASNVALWEVVFKAFSLFKKWQHSSMKLLVINYSYSHIIEIKIPTYKYKDDVVIVNNPDEHISSRLLAASYAMVYPAKLNYLPLPVLQAIKCNIPAIVTKSIADAAGNTEAFYWMEEPEPQSFSNQMILCYKNEEFRKQVIQNANAITESHSFSHLTEQMNCLIDEVVV